MLFMRFQNLQKKFLCSFYLARYKYIDILYKSIVFVIYLKPELFIRSVSPTYFTINNMRTVDTITIFLLRHTKLKMCYCYLFFKIYTRYITWLILAIFRNNLERIHILGVIIYKSYNIFIYYIVIFSSYERRAFLKFCRII